MLATQLRSVVRRAALCACAAFAVASFLPSGAQTNAPQVSPAIALAEASAVQTANSVAKAGNQYYDDLPAAIDAANAGSTITLVKDTQLTVDLTISKSLTLDLNSHVVSNVRLTIPAGTLTITDTSAAQTGSLQHASSYTVYLTGGSLNLSAGTISASTYGVFNSGSGSVTVSGGAITSAKGYAIYSSANSSVTVTGGSISAYKNAFYSLGKLSISGGFISSQTADPYIGTYKKGMCSITGGSYQPVEPDFYMYLPSPDYTFGPAPDASGYYAFALREPMAKIGSTEYRSLASAIAATQPGGNETITLLRDVTDGTGIGTPDGASAKAFTIDFAGHSYSVLGATVGSSGTETQAVHLGAQSNVTFKNGTLTSDSRSESVMMFMQNYANATFDNMTVDVSHVKPSYASQYAQFNFNNGSSVLRNTRLVFGADNVTGCTLNMGGNPKWYTAGASLAIEGSSAIEGNFTVSGGGGSASGLTITGGSFANLVVEDPEAVKPATTITGGAFNADPSALPSASGSGATDLVSSAYAAAASGNDEAPWVVSEIYLSISPSSPAYDTVTSNAPNKTATLSVVSNLRGAKAKWSSASATKATVPAGPSATATLTAVAPGSVQVTAVLYDSTGTNKVLDKDGNEITATCTVADADISASLAETSYELGATGVVPEPQVTYQGIALTKDVHYTLSYANNTEVGASASVTVTAISPFSGTVTLPFTVTGDLRDTVVALEKAQYDAVAGGVQPKVTSVTLYGKPVPTTAYRVSYENNEANGVGSVVLTAVEGSGYVGTRSAPFIVGDGKSALMPDTPVSGGLDQPGAPDVPTSGSADTPGLPNASEQPLDTPPVHEDAGTPHDLLVPEQPEDLMGELIPESPGEPDQPIAPGEPVPETPAVPTPSEMPAVPTGATSDDPLPAEFSRRADASGNPQSLLAAADGSLAQGWVKTSDGSIYYAQQGVAKTGKDEIDGLTYVFDNTGKLLTSWYDDPATGEHYYLYRACDAGITGSMAEDCWIYVPEENGWYVAMGDGRILAGWARDSETGNHYFFDGSNEADGAYGKMATGWLCEYDGSWYYLFRPGDNGVEGARAQNGWLCVDGSWYYCSEDNGAIESGWLFWSGSWYYFSTLRDGTFGKMMQGWFMDETGSWFFADEGSGTLKTGWLLWGGRWFHLHDGPDGVCGAMDTGWIWSDAGWYYLSSDGAMLTSSWTPDGHYVGADGLWVV